MAFTVLSLVAACNANLQLNVKSSGGDIQGHTSGFIPQTRLFQDLRNSWRAGHDAGRKPAGSLVTILHVIQIGCERQ